MIEKKGDRLLVSGALTMATVAELHGQGVPSQAVSPWVIDLAAVEAVDSAAVALLLAWLRQAQARGLNLRFENLPPNLTSLAQMYGVNELLAA